MHNASHVNNQIILITVQIIVKLLMPRTILIMVQCIIEINQ